MPLASSSSPATVYEEEEEEEDTSRAGLLTQKGPGVGESIVTVGYRSSPALC
jgi:hypothetical protein